jgi:hypothetical protein
MTERQEMKVRRNAYKYYDEVIYSNRDWNMRDITLSSFYAGAEYALKNKHDELKEESHGIVRFLKDNGVYDVFFANLLKQKQGDDLYQYFLLGFNTSAAISSAFIWINTPEGNDFWEELSDRFGSQF